MVDLRSGTNKTGLILEQEKKMVLLLNVVDQNKKADAKRKYPKCVPLAKAKRMSAAQIRSAVSRKRTAERKPRTGKKPNYVRT